MAVQFPSPGRDTQETHEEDEGCHLQFEPMIPAHPDCPSMSRRPGCLSCCECTGKEAWLDKVCFHASPFAGTIPHRLSWPKPEFSLLLFWYYDSRRLWMNGSPFDDGHFLAKNGHPCSSLSCSECSRHGRLIPNQLQAVVVK